MAEFFIPCRICIMQLCFLYARIQDFSRRGGGGEGVGGWYLGVVESMHAPKCDSLINWNLADNFTTEIAFAFVCHDIHIKFFLFLLLLLQRGHD